MISSWSTVHGGLRLVSVFGLPQVVSHHDHPHVLVTTHRHLAAPIGCPLPRAWCDHLGRYVAPERWVILDRGACSTCGEIGPIITERAGGSIAPWKCVGCYRCRGPSKK